MDYRSQLVKSLKMTQDEQTWCWALLGDVQIAQNNRDAVLLDAHLVALRQRLQWLRAETGLAWQKAQQIDLEE